MSKMFEYFHNKPTSTNAVIVWEDENKMVIEIDFKPPYYCGYVAIKKQLLGEDNLFKLSTMIKLSNMIRVHGGITFIEVETDDVIFGFDCGHAYDAADKNTRKWKWIINEIETMEREIIYHCSVKGGVKKSC